MEGGERGRESERERERGREHSIASSAVPVDMGGRSPKWSTVIWP